MSSDRPHDELGVLRTRWTLPRAQLAHAEVRKWFTLPVSGNGGSVASMPSGNPMNEKLQLSVIMLGQARAGVVGVQPHLWAQFIVG